MDVLFISMLLRGKVIQFVTVVADHTSKKKIMQEIETSVREKRSSSSPPLTYFQQEDVDVVMS